MPVNFQEAQELRDRRQRIVTEADGILTTAHGEDRPMSEEERAKWQRMHDDANALTARIDDIERQLTAAEGAADQVRKLRKIRELAVDDAADEAIEQGLQGSEVEQARRARDREVVADILGAEREQEIRELELRGFDRERPIEQRVSETLHYRQAFNEYMALGIQDAPEVVRSLMQRTFAAAQIERRALTIGTDATGGYLIPEGFGRLIEIMQWFGPMLSVGTKLNTSSGNDLPFPTNDDTGNSGVQIGENTDVGEQDTTFGVATLSAYIYTSRAIRVPIALLQDEAIGLERYLGNIMGKRIGRIVNQRLTTGTGTAQPQGVVTGATAGATAAAAGAVAYTDFLNLKHAVDPAYRQSPGFKFMFEDATLLALKSLLDGDGRPLWAPSPRVGAPSTFDGTPYDINQDVASIGTGNISAICGDMDLYLVREVNGVRLVRLTERWGEFLQVGFLAYARYDGRLLDTTAVRRLTHP